VTVATGERDRVTVATGERDGVTVATEIKVSDSCLAGDEHCITCGDVAIEMTVITVDMATGLALCEADDGGREMIEVALVADVRPADRLLAHAGTAIARLSACSHPDTPHRL
jgi:hypothetical protein